MRVARGSASLFSSPGRGLGPRDVPLELFRGPQTPRRAVCGTRGSLRTMQGGGSAPSCCSFPPRVAFEEGSGPRVLLKSEKNHVVPTAWQDEALARDGVSREVPCSALKGETVPDSLPAQRRVVWMWFGALPGASGLGRAQPQRRGTSP